MYDLLKYSKRRENGDRGFKPVRLFFRQGGVNFSRFCTNVFIEGPFGTEDI